MNVRTKRILVTILCAVLALALILPSFTLAFRAEGSGSVPALRTYSVSLTNPVDPANPTIVSVEIDSDYMLPFCSFENPGHVFAGWFCTNDGKRYLPGDIFRNTTKLPTVTFFVEWETDPTSSGTVSEQTAATVTFVSGRDSDVTGTAPEPVTVEIGGSLILPENPFTAEGYVFAGWDVRSALMQPGEEVTDVAGDLVIRAAWKEPSASSEISSEIVSAASEVPSGETSSEIASEEPVQYSVRLLPGGGEGEELVLGPFEPNANFVFTEELHTRFSRSGYDFNGWKVDGKVYRDGQMLTLTEDITAEAQWERLPTSSSTPAVSRQTASVPTSSSDTPHGYTDPATGISLDGGLTFDNTMRVKKYSRTSSTDVYTAMLLHSDALIVGYNIYVSSDISFTGGHLTIPVQLDESDRSGAVVLYHVVDSKEVRLDKYTTDELTDKITFDTSGGQPMVSKVDFTADYPDRFALNVGNGKYAEIYIYPGNVNQLELDVTFLSPFLICRAEANYASSASVPAASTPAKPDTDDDSILPAGTLIPVVIALGIAVICVAVIIAVRCNGSGGSRAARRASWEANARAEEYDDFGAEEDEEDEDLDAYNKTDDDDDDDDLWSSPQ